MSDSKEFDYVMLRSFLLGEGFTIDDDCPLDPYNCGYLMESAFVVGKAITIGQYANIEHKILALAHEAGHRYSGYKHLHKHFNYKHKDMQQEHHSLINESMAWEAAFNLLDELNIEISDDALSYVTGCIESYMGYKG